MQPVERIGDSPDHWPAIDELRETAVGSDLVFLPDRIDTIEGQVVAAFRLDAQGLRVSALEAGLRPLLYQPPGAELAVHTENAADWVLPVIVAAALSFPAGVAATVAADWIEAQTSHHPNTSTVLYREAVDDHGRWKLYEVEGTPHAVVQVLRARAEDDDSMGSSSPDQSGP